MLRTAAALSSPPTGGAAGASTTGSEGGRNGGGDGGGAGSASALGANGGCGAGSASGTRAGAGSAGLLLRVNCFGGAPDWDAAASPAGMDMSKRVSMRSTRCSSADSVSLADGNSSRAHTTSSSSRGAVAPRISPSPACTTSAYRVRVVACVDHRLDRPEQRRGVPCCQRVNRIVDQRHVRRAEQGQRPLVLDPTSFGPCEQLVQHR